MLSLLSIISIFVEISVAGIALTGAYTFVHRYFEHKEIKDFFLALIFLCLATFASLSLFSQIYYNLDGLVSVLINTQKAIIINFILMGIFSLAFARSRFKLRIGWLILLLIPALSYYAYQIIILPLSSVTLNFRPDVIEPVVTMGLLPLIYKPFWAIVMLFIAMMSFIHAMLRKGGEKSLSIYNGIAAILFFSSYILSNVYVIEGQALYLAASWAVILIATLLLIISEIMSPESKIAEHPLNFVRSRILFKLSFVFILLIVILFELTTLATLTLSKRALYDSIINNYKEISVSTAEKIDALPSFSPERIQELVNDRSVKNRFVYVVDGQGKIIAHPDETRAKSRIDVNNLPFIKNLLNKKSGGGILPPDEFGDIKAGAYTPFNKYGGGVVVEEPIREAFEKMRFLETNSLLFIIAGIVLTVFCGMMFAESIEQPLHLLTMGTEEISKGNLNAHIEIKAIDEIGTLATAFNKMTKDLRDSQEKLILSEKLASLGTMAAGMAHEIKNPLVSLRTFTQLLEQKWEDKEFREKFSQIVPREIERINKIAESLLKFGRPMKPEFKKVNINSILEEIILLFESECKKNNVRVTTKFTTLPDLTGDEQQLSQVFINLILNAIQAMEEQKGGELIIKTDVGEILKIGKPVKQGIEKGTGEMVWEAEEESPAPIPAVFIEITDTGPGIEPGQIKSLFDPFYTTKAKGTGMGLPITLRIIEEHKGSITIRSKLGKGTSFIVSLPQKPDQIPDVPHK